MSYGLSPSLISKMKFSSNYPFSGVFIIHNISLLMHAISLWLISVQIRSYFLFRNQQFVRPSTCSGMGCALKEIALKESRMFLDSDSEWISRWRIWPEMHLLSYSQLGSRKQFIVSSPQKGLLNYALFTAVLEDRSNVATRTECCRLHSDEEDLIQL